MLGLLLCASLLWDASPDLDIAGYNRYHGSQSRTYTERYPVGNVTSNRLQTLSYGPHYFAVTAVNTSGLESDFSNEVFLNGWLRLTVAPCPPEGISLFFDTLAGESYAVESSTLMVPWFGWLDRVHADGTGQKMEVSLPVRQEAEYFRIRTL